MSDNKRIKPSLSKGTRDFLPVEVAQRNYIFDVIKGVFRKYGFQQIETPAMERLETLTGKYGDEGDKLLFRILNSGDFLKDVPKEELSAGNPAQLLKQIAEKGLRYDLTVPLARYVVQHQDEIVFPFKRFHIGPVWRADRPQKGRYQEFYQCDADAIGSNSLLNEVELTAIYAEVFNRLGVNAIIKINSRKVLEAVAAYIGETEKLTDITVAIDKMDKIGLEGVKTELEKLGLSSEKQNRLLSLLAAKTTAELTEALGGIEKGRQGINEIDYLVKNAGTGRVVFDITLARGLNYYTGIIWEVVCEDVKIGSLGGGGRYDDLTAMFGGQNMSGVGISFGIERIYDVMQELNLFPATILGGVELLLVARDEVAEDFTLQLAQDLRKKDIAVEIFTGNVKKQKQFAYAEGKNIAYIAEIGANELTSNLLRLRNVKARTEEGTGFSPAQLASFLKKEA